MSERKVLAAVLKSRKAYDEIKDKLTQGDFTEQANVIWREVDAFYGRDAQAETCDIELVGNGISRSLKAAKHRDAFAELLRDISSSTVSADNVVHDFLAVKREAVGARLATKLVSGDESGVDELMEEYKTWQENHVTTDLGDSRQVLRGSPLAEIIRPYTEGELIRVWPTSLNNRLDGGLLRGHHMVVFARPEMGKTMFLVNAVAGFLAQKLVVLYVGNEDPITDIILRVVCRLTQRDKFTVLSSPEDSEAAAREKGYDNFIIAALAPGTPREIDDLVEEFKPDVLLIDQLRNINVANKEGNYTQQLEKAATSVRNIGKRHGVLVISVTQAGDSASGKAILDMGDVDSSNTGIPAQADVMVGIGATQEDQQMGRRVLSLPKNKRSGNHSYFPVRVDPALNRIINVEDV